MSSVFVSDAVDEERLAFGLTPPSGNPARRRWKQLSTLYQASLLACRFAVEPVIRPEIYQTEPARKARGVSHGDWHLAVKPIEHIRPFQGIPNVFVCDWPFPELCASSHGVSPFLDHVRLLKKADVVACCTDFTAQSLRNAGVERVITLPPHVSMPVEADIPVRHPPRDRRTFISVIDSNRLLRQLPPTLEGFAQALAHHGDLRLVVRIIGGGRPPVASLGDSSAVSIVVDTPSGTTPTADLLGSADFFLFSSSAEGLPLPLVEAMLAGVPIVTTVSSGMGSFLLPGSVVPIAAESAPVEEVEERLAGFMQLTCSPPAAEAIRDAILAALDLDETTLADMTGTCRSIADRHFGLAAFKTGLERLGKYVPLRLL